MSQHNSSRARDVSRESYNLATLSSALDAYCRRYGYEHATALDQLSTTIVHFFEWDTQSPTPTQATVLGGFASEQKVAEIKNALHVLMRYFFLALHTELAHRKWVDLFGDYFMEYGANKKDRGQCFTPDSVCELLASLSLSINEGTDFDTMRHYVPGFGRKVVVNDCACGSGRLLLAAGSTYRHITHKNDVYLVASDIDDRCCKQSAINLLLHGFYGEVACMDTLMGESSFSHGWIINQGLYPIPFGLPTLTYTTDKSKFFQYQRNIIGNPPFEESNNASK